MAMDDKVYLPDEAAAILRVSPEQMAEAIANREIDAFCFAGQWRITEEALVKVMRGGAHSRRVDDGTRGEARTPVSLTAGAPVHAARQQSEMHEESEMREEQGSNERITDPLRVTKAREWVWERLKQIAPDLWPRSPGTKFSVSGKQGIVATAVSVKQTKAGDDYFFGIAQKLLETGRPTFIVALLAPRQIPAIAIRAFVIPCARFQDAIDGWSTDQSGHQKKFHILEKSGDYWLKGKGMEPMNIGECLNAFDSLR